MGKSDRPDDPTSALQPSRREYRIVIGPLAVAELTRKTEKPQVLKRHLGHPGGAVVPPLNLLFAFPGKRESDEGIANRVITRMAATQAVTIRGDTAIGDISTERVDNKFASICEVGYGAGRRSTGVGNVGRSVERKQLLARLCVNSIKCPVALTKENHIACNEHARLGGLRDLNLPNNFTCPRVGGSVYAKGLCTRNVIDEGGAQVKVTVDRLGDKTVIAGVRLEDIRVVPGAVVDVFCPWAISCRVPLASPVVTRHNQPQHLIGRSVLGRKENFGLTWSEEGRKSSGYGSRVGLFLRRELVE